MTLQQSNQLVYQICTNAEFAFTESNLRNFVDANVAKHWLQLVPQRQTIYQKLVLANVLDVLSYVFKATQKCVNADGPIFASWVAGFLKSQGIATRFYHQIPLEFWQWLKQNPQFEKWHSEPVWSVVEFEITRWQLYQNPNGVLPKAAAMDLPLSQVRLQFTAAVQCRFYDWPVHRFASDLQPVHLQTKAATHLVLYRHPETLTVEVCEWTPAALSFVRWALQHASHLTVEELILEFTNANRDSSLTASDVLVFLQNILKLGIALIVERVSTPIRSSEI